MCPESNILGVAQMVLLQKTLSRNVKLGREMKYVKRFKLEFTIFLVMTTTVALKVSKQMWKRRIPLFFQKLKDSNFQLQRETN